MKKINFLALSASLLLSASTFAQAPNIQWSKLYGGNREEEARSIKQTPDGGFIVAGSTLSEVSGDISDRIGGKDTDYWILKLDADGDIEWEKVYGGRNEDKAEAIELTKDGGYIITGTSASDDGDVMNHVGHMDYWVVKLDNTGKIEWERSFGGQDQDESYDIKQTSDEGFIVTGTYNTYGTTNGYNSNDIYIAKLDKSGNTEWDKFLGGTGNDVAYSALQTFDGGYLLGGLTTSTDGDVASKYNGGGDWWIVKLDIDGNLEWETTYGGSDLEYLNGMVQTPDSNYVLTGWTRSTDILRSVNNKFTDILVVKLSQDGQQFIWEKAFGGSSTDEGTAIANTADNGLIITGFSYSDDENFKGNHGGHDAFLLKLNADGDMEWLKLVGGSEYDEAYSVCTTTDGGFAITGFSESRDGDVPTHDFDARKFWIVRFEGPEVDSIVVKTMGEVPAIISTPEGTLPLKATTYPLILNQDVVWSIVPVTGEASIDANGVVTAQADGTVWGKAVSLFNPLMSDSIEITIANQTSNILALTAAEGFDIYPNPINDILSLKGNNHHPQLSLSILNIEGKVLGQFQIAPNMLAGKSMQFDLNELPSGIYIMTLNGGKFNINKVLIKK